MESSCRRGGIRLSCGRGPCSGYGPYNAIAARGDYLYDPLSPLGDTADSAAATSDGFLSELLSLF
jgi:hypothetical protein